MHHSRFFTVVNCVGFCVSLWGAIVPNAGAVYKQSVTWADMSSLNLKPALHSDYSSDSNLLQPIISDSALDVVLKDSDSLISPEFHIPPSMRTNVTFWIRIYTEYTTEQLVIFDQRHPEVIYEALDFRELAKKARNRFAYEIESKNQVKRRIRAYRAAFAHLEKVPNPQHPTREETIILTRIKKLPHHHTFRELARHLRSQTGQRDNIMKGLLAAETFFPRMEMLFSKVGVPVELTRLSLVESSFNLSSVSRVGAAGVWQFMPSSAKEYLLMDPRNQIDERLSPLKSSVAAAKLLKRNYAVFGNWASAVTAYNHGMRGLPRRGDKEATLARVLKMFALCSSQRSPLGWASRNYYSEFLAVLHAEAYRKTFYGEPPVQELRPTVFARVEKPQDALKFASAYHMTAQEFKMLNPDIQNLKRPLPHGIWIAVLGSDDDIGVLTTAKRVRVARR